MRSTCRAPQRFRVSDPITVPLGFNRAVQHSTVFSNHLRCSWSPAGRQARQGQHRLEADVFILFHCGEGA